MTPTPNNNLDSSKSNALKTGPPLVGIILNWWLFGILFMQYLLYLSHETKKDRKIIRIIVHLLFLIDAAQSILVVEDAFRWFVFNFGNYEPLAHSGFPGIDGQLLDCIIAMMVQSVYCWRIWVLSRWKVFPAFVAFLALVSGVCGVWSGIYAVVHGFVGNLKTLQWYIPSLIWLWAAGATDVIIAATMAYLFRSRNCSPGLKAVLKHLLILTLETNALTAIVAIVTAILSLFPTLGPPFANFYRAGGYTLGKLYSNCFMVLLNQRIYYEKLSQGQRPPTTDLGTLEFAHPGGGLHSGITSTGDSDVTGEVSVIQFSNATTQVGFKSGPSVNDVELGESRQGLRMLVDTAGATGEK